MSDYNQLKDKCKENNQALVMAIKPNGEVCIYVNPDSTEKEMMQSMIIASAKIAEEWSNKQ